MRTRILVLGLVWAASLCAQRKFHWQDYCFNHPRAPFCGGKEYAVKPPGRAKDALANLAKSAGQPADPNQPTAQIVPGKIDWRFADPLSDGVAWFNFAGLASSPVAREFIKQPLLDGLAGVKEVAISVHEGRVVAMVTGDVTDATFVVPDAAFKAVPVAGNGMLLGHADAVDQAVKRMAASGGVAEMPQDGGAFWAIASTTLAGPEVKQLLVTAGDVTVEFNAVPTAETLRTWPSGGTVEGNTLHVKMSMDAMAASPAGRQFAAGLIEAARFIPAPGAAAPKHTRPVIYGLDGGPRVGQEPKR